MICSGSDALGSLMLLVALLAVTGAWTCPVSAPTAYGCARRATLAFSARSNDNDKDHLLNQQNSDARREQEIILEDLSLKGADKITKMDISERAKRAMLAEAVEDRIFELTEVIESMLDEDGSIKRHVKELQLTYSDLVNGNPAPILNALASLESNETDM